MYQKNVKRVMFCRFYASFYVKYYIQMSNTCFMKSTEYSVKNQQYRFILNPRILNMVSKIMQNPKYGVQNYSKFAIRCARSWIIPITNLTSMAVHWRTQSTFWQKLFQPFHSFIFKINHNDFYNNPIVSNCIIYQKIPLLIR